MKRSLCLSLAFLVAGCASAQSSGEPADGPRADAPRASDQVADGPSAPLTPSQRAALRVTELRVEPEEVTLQVGESAELRITARDSAGEPVTGVQVGRYVQGRAVVYHASSGEVEALSPGEVTFHAVVQQPGRDGEEGRDITARSEITVRPLPVARLELSAPEAPVYAGTRVRLEATAHSERAEREDAEIEWSSSDPGVARVSGHGLLQAGSPGSTTVTATSEGVSESVAVEVRDNPVRSLELERPEEEVTVGDVVRLEARPLDGSGNTVEDAPVEWTITGPLGSPVEGGYIGEDGAFVASMDGLYRVTATVGDRSAVQELEARARPGRREMEAVGHGVVENHATSDLWVFEGIDGVDYAYTGTHAAGAGGNVMYAWDVSDPENPTITDSVVVDARVVNDVKINETRTLAVITREGASDRRNGLVILDIRVPAHPRILSSFTENLTAGVHNTWIEDDLVYAINDGTLAVHIVDISDPEAPREVGRWELERENKYLHDVIVQDGLAYLSYWDDGLVILDVGRGIAGGTPTEPEMVSQFVYRSQQGAEEYGNTHHAIPYGDYVFVGDEIFGCEECVNGPRGYVHVLDVSDIENPEEVAWFRVPEAGTHNLWVEDDRLYIAYYQGGVRVVDISGELRGNLYEQGREIGWFMTESEDGFVPNSTMAWGPQPYEGLIYATDMNSGLWILKLAEERSGE